MEIELKFQLPESQKKSVLQRLKKADAQHIHLQAKYYDTPDRLLAKNNIAIRLRKEGNNDGAHWVQTFKAAAKSDLHRIEVDIDLGQCEQEPELDLSLYQHNKTVKRLLKKVLKSSTDTLQLQFQTDVQRDYAVVHIKDSVIEICLDDGEVRSSDASSRICEVEFELKQGSVEHLIESAKAWVSHYSLWLDVRSKAERGSLLASAKAVSPAVHAKQLILSDKTPAEQVLQQIVANCLNHLLPNSSAIAGLVAEAEHIHQARIAIRRLRSALKHFGQWSTSIDPQWHEQLAILFRQLGATRDVDMIHADILPKLVNIGAPVLTLPAIHQDAQYLASLFTQANTVHLLLELLNFAHADDQSANQNPDLKKAIAKRLQRLHQHVTQDADQFSTLEIEQRHRIRKQAKQLRYGVEFIASLYPQKQVQHYLKQLQPVLDCLGRYNDLVVAETWFAQQVEQNVHFWFAIGWLKAQQQQVLIEAEQVLKSFAHSKTFW